MTLPETITDAIREYASAVENTMSWCHAPGDWDSRENAMAALKSAILSALDAAREGALREWSAQADRAMRLYAEREQARSALKAVTECEEHRPCGLCRERVRVALAPRPSPEAEPACHPATPDHIQMVRATAEQIEAFNAAPGQRWVIYFEAPGGGTAQTLATLKHYPVMKADPAPEKGGLPCPVCDDGIEEPCPRCAPEPAPESEECGAETVSGRCWLDAGHPGEHDDRLLCLEPAPRTVEDR